MDYDSRHCRSTRHRILFVQKLFARRLAVGREYSFDTGAARASSQQSLGLDDTRSFGHAGTQLIKRFIDAKGYELILDRTGKAVAAGTKGPRFP